jgi:hypothetical protein
VTRSAIPHGDNVPCGHRVGDGVGLDDDVPAHVAQLLHQPIAGPVVAGRSHAALAELQLANCVIQGPGAGELFDAHGGLEQAVAQVDEEGNGQAQEAQER